MIQKRLHYLFLTVCLGVLGAFFFAAPAAQADASDNRSIASAGEQGPRVAATLVYLPIIAAGQPQPTATPTPTPLPSATAIQPLPTSTATAAPTAAGIGATVGITLPQRLQSDAGALRYGAVSAIFYAGQTANTGGTVTTGTLTVSGPNQFTYTATPTDRLQLVLADGRTMTLYVTTVTGSDGSSPDAYLDSTHHFAARIVTGPPGDAPDPNVTLPANADINLVSTLANGVTGLSVNGTLDVAGTPHTADLAAEGTIFFDSSGGSIHYISNYTVTGTIEGGTLGLTVAERYRNERISDSTFSVSTADTHINNTWRYGEGNGGQTYALQNGLIRRSFQNGYVNESEIDSYWFAGGQLLQDGAVVGNLGLNLNALYMEVVVEIGDGSYLFQRFRRPTTIEPTSSGLSERKWEADEHRIFFNTFPVERERYLRAGTVMANAMSVPEQGNGDDTSA